VSSEKGNIVPWAVVMTKPNCENLAVHNLCRQGFDCYAPRFRVKAPDRTIQIKHLFPRYIFTFIQNGWYSIRGNFGVSSILMGLSGPEYITPAIIEGIKDRENDEGFVVLPESTDTRFRKGDQVKAIEGPMAGKLMIYEGMTTRERVQVLLTAFGRQVRTTVDEKLLVAA
jgi:transcriptional antiterminator RfaH